MKCIELFAGCGGLSAGLEMSGFKTVLANEMDPIKASSFKLNNPSSEVVTGDIRNIPDEVFKLDDISLVAGGPPCQGFSINAPIRSLDDDRNHLFKEFMRVVSLATPKAVLLENVPGMLSLGQGTVVKAILTELDALGYTIDFKILFAGHYGVPQTRFRTIFLGIRKSLGKHPSFPTPTHNASSVANFTGGRTHTFKIIGMPNLLPMTTVNDVLSDLPSLTNGDCGMGTRRYKTQSSNATQDYLRRSGSDEVSQHGCPRLSDINLERLRHIPQGGNWTNIPIELLPAGLVKAKRSDHTRRYGRLDPSGMCSTVMTKVDPHWGSFFHPYEDRVLSVREAARMQSFPDDHMFTGSMTQMYEQIGNAVPPLMAKAIGDMVRDIISK